VKKSLTTKVTKYHEGKQKEKVLRVPSCPLWLKVLVLVGVGMLPGCGEQRATLEGPVAVKSAAKPPATEWPDVTAPRIEGERALAHARALAGFGPRPAGSAAHKKMQQYIVARLQNELRGGAQIEDDSFEAQTPTGKLAMRNLIAKFPGTKEGVIVLATHYDTKKMPRFVGANDGGSSTAVLLAIAEQLRAGMKDGKRQGYSVWLAFFDGEEAVGENITPSDGLYGSRHLAEKWRQDGTLKNIKALILADMVGDRELEILRDGNSTPWLLDLVGAAADKLGHQSHFFGYQSEMIDDHVPFKEAGVPVADLIDFDYGYQNAFWHTPEDTVDKLSPRSLEIVGNVMLQAVWMLDRK